MFNTINEAYNENRSKVRDNELIAEAAFDIEEVAPGSEEEIEDEIDVDSIPDEVMSKMDKAMDDLIGSDKFDDEDIDSLIDEDDDSDIDTEIDEIEISESATPAKRFIGALHEAAKWYDDPGIHHPDTSRRSGNAHQPIFNPGEESFNL